ncbi:MAG: T9SS type A sorting domain-containing protein [Saprospiraceae bacterium]
MNHKNLCLSASKIDSFSKLCTRLILNLKCLINYFGNTKGVLFDRLGREITAVMLQTIHQNRFFIPTNELATGVYWLKIQIGDQWLVRKVVRQ